MPSDGHVTGFSAQADIEFFFPAIPKDLRLISLGLDSTGLRLVLQSSVEGEAVLESSTDLEEWIPAIDRVTVGKPFLVNPEAAYYRARWIPSPSR